MESKDWYAVLGVARDASDEDIKTAARRLRALYHTDRAGGSEEKIRDVNEAYRILSDADLRAEFDLTGMVADEVNFDAMACGLLGEFLSQVLELETHVDVVSVVGQLLQGNKSRVTKALAEVKRKIRRVQRNSERVTNPEGGDNFVRIFAQMRLSELRIDQANGEKALAVIDLAQSKMRDLECGPPVSEDGDFLLRWVSGREW